MEIENKGFRVTGICEAVPDIEVFESGEVIICVMTDLGEEHDSKRLSMEDFADLHSAINATYARIHGLSSGARRPGPVLTEEMVYEIRKRLAAGELGRALARDFGVSEASISNIRRRKTWPHLPRIKP